MDYPESFGDFFRNLFASDDFMPHGHCYLWRPEMLWLHGASDVLIAAAYFSIPLALIYFVRRRTDLAFPWMFVMFGVFILACGTTHVLSVVTLWKPIYRFDGVVKAGTALVSIASAVALWRLMPQALALPSPAQLGVANDQLQLEIVERRRAEELLRTREERFRLLIDGVQDYAFFMLDLTGHIDNWNAGAERLTGFAAAEITGRHFGCFYEPDGLTRGLPEQALTIALGGGRSEMVSPHLRKDGSRFWANVIITAVHDRSGAVAGFSCIIHDITRRRQAEESLAKHQALLQALIDNLPDLIFVKDPQSRVVLSNPAHQRVLGVATQEEAVGKRDSDFFPPDLASAYYADEQTVLRTGQPLVNNEERYLDSQGRSGWLSTTKVPLRDAAGKMTGIVGMSRDITARIQTEQELRATAAALEKSNAELQQFAYVASHDLQEPLRGVSGYLQLVERQTGDTLSAETAGYIKKSIDGVRRMQGLINDLLIVSRLETKKRPSSTVDGDRVLDQALANLDVVIIESGAVIVRTALPQIPADGVQLTQVFQHLIANAIKFRSRQPLQIHIGAEPVADGWRFMVRDNGIGIDPQHAGRIFLIFQRLHTRTEYPGSGIGLAICKKIVEGHGGNIGVESAVGQGATFWFTIPVNRGKSP